MISEILTRVYFENSVRAYLMCVAVILAGTIVVWILKTVVLIKLRAWAERTTNILDDFLVLAAGKYLVPLLHFGVVYMSLTSLHLPMGMLKALSALSSIIITIFGIHFMTQIARFALFDVYLKRLPDQDAVEKRFRGLMPAVHVAIWTVGLLFLLDNLGFKISAIMAGLGIGGVAVALAASAVLADLFAYMVIMFDQPFVLGDFITVGDFKGTIENIGIKTTRVRSQGGEMLVIANKDLTDSRLRNFKAMQHRRIQFKLGITYDTPNAKIKEIPALIKSLIEKSPDTTFDRAHFSSFLDSSLEIDVVYIVKSADFNRYMDIQQDVNLAIKEEFEKRGIEFAFPTQTLYMNSVSAR